MREVRFTLDDESYRQVRLAAAGRLVSVAQWCRAALAMSVEGGRVDEATLLGKGFMAGVKDGTPDVLAAADAAVKPAQKARKRASDAEPTPSDPTHWDGEPTAEMDPSDVERLLAPLGDPAPDAV